MGAPITNFEVIESIRFLAQLVGTDGLSEGVKTKANGYIERLLDALEGSVQQATATSSGITLLK